VLDGRPQVPQQHLGHVLVVVVQELGAAIVNDAPAPARR
jgi:hypothetical protein